MSTRAPSPEAPSKSAIKKAERLAALAARKSLKQVIATTGGNPQATGGGGGGKRKEKLVAPVLVELAFIEVEEGMKKGQSG